MLWIYKEKSIRWTPNFLGKWSIGQIGNVIFIGLINLRTPLEMSLMIYMEVGKRGLYVLLCEIGGWFMYRTQNSF